MVQLGAKLRELRRRNGLSQEQVANVLGITRQAISKWESNTAQPDLDTLIKHAKYLIFHQTRYLNYNSKHQIKSRKNPQEMSIKFVRVQILFIVNYLLSSYYSLLLMFFSYI